MFGNIIAFILGVLLGGTTAYVYLSVTNKLK